MCPHKSPEAIVLWGKACNFHRGSDPRHVCGNPGACRRTLIKAITAENQFLEFIRRWS